MRHLTFLRKMLFYFVLAHSLFNPGAAQANEHLPALNASIQDLTVSGLSSGGFMAVQMHVAHSSLVRGAGILAGGPYYCAQGSIFKAVNHCMNPGFWTPLPAIKQLVSYTETNADKGQIDDDKNLSSSRVWLLSGNRDRTVKTEVVDQLYDFYNNWIHASSIAYERIPGAGHAMIGNDAPNANACDMSKSPYINHCDDFDAPGRLLAFLLGSLAPKAKAVPGNLVSFSQNEFVEEDLGDTGLADTGYAYIPATCKNGQCRIHVAFHGCDQQAESIGELYVRDAGYNGWAESNRLIVLYPQIHANSFNNPNGCWDWWGYTDGNYAVKSGKQIRAVKKMIDRLAEPVQSPE